MADDALNIFDHIESQTSDGDKRSLLALRDLVAADGPFAYLEIGSHLGGSLQPFVVDERCTSIISIDPRPLSQPDNRLPEDEHYHYDGNSTERMLELLGEMPGADLDKVTTIEAGTQAIDPSSIDVEPALCFVDGEHTDRTALADALFCASVAPRSIVAFHDCSVVGRGISAFMRVAGGYGHPLPDSVFVVDLADRRRLDAAQRRPRLWRAANAAGLAATAAAVKPLKQTSAARRLKAAIKSR